MFCGILPWTWFSSSLSESAGVLISGGNLIKKVLFPAEILPIVSVLANMVHFFFGLPILAGFLLYYHRPLQRRRARAFPAWSSWCSSSLTMGFALILSALTVHFRDIRDILSNLLTFWFFATPIIYPVFHLRGSEEPRTHARGRPRLLKLNPFTHLAITYQEILFFDGPVGHWKWLLLLGAHLASCSSCSVTSCSIGCATRLRRKCEEQLPAPAASSPVFRRLAAQTGTGQLDATRTGNWKLEAGSW